MSERDWTLEIETASGEVKRVKAVGKNHKVAYESIKEIFDAVLLVNAVSRGKAKLS